MSVQRIRFFDIAKGVGILCVVLGHASIETANVYPSNMAEFFYCFCFSFHMPLFFILSGYFMHPERNFRWLKESKQLIFTYILATFGVVLLAGLVAYICHAGVVETMKFWMKAAWYGSGDVSDMTLWHVEGRIGAIWFLLAMFWARLIMHVFARLPYTSVWVFACFVAGYVMSRNLWLPWSMQSGMCAVAFVYLGYLARKHEVMGYVKKKPWLWAVVFVVWALAIYKFTGFSMAMNQYGQYPVLAIIGSIAGTLCIVGVSKMLDRVSLAGAILNRAGTATLAILCVHIVEDDALPWTLIITEVQEHLSGFPIVFVIFVLHLVIDLPGAWALYYIPVINTWFYPQLVKKRIFDPDIEPVSRSVKSGMDIKHSEHYITQMDEE
ncbi:acyltransferase family protein [Bifidobacterium choloepi]|uniref:Acyltransferase family protein n=1 Tax=Bifidobacterium choloepi TaxID=2614131 RepID=A0A6I5N484_9BIFI|nr:acyltransferase family protein [Bifidobacterium choloepi]